MTHCLIVEGTSDDKKRLSLLLGQYGFELETVADADDALDRCRQSMPDVIVMSDSLAHMDSAEFLARLNRGAKGAAPKVIVYSEEPDAGAIGRHIWTGAAECMVKPFDADIIDLKLRQVGLL
jgi:two-component system chemotaxis response regulator CheY